MSISPGHVTAVASTIVVPSGAARFSPTSLITRSHQDIQSRIELLGRVDHPSALDQQIHMVTSL